MQVKDWGAAARSKAELEELEIESEHTDISEMPDTKLLRFGMSVRFRCAGSAKPARLISQLEEARKEWNSRRPNLPLADSF